MPFVSKKIKQSMAKLIASSLSILLEFVVDFAGSIQNEEYNE
jgi:hypothetical protein